MLAALLLLVELGPKGPMSAPMRALAAAQNSEQTAEQRLTKLGRERADFGDIPNSGKWKYVDTGSFGGTYIYFLLGRADVRYYFIAGRQQDVPDRIVRTSKKNGKISRDWLIELTGPGKGPVRKGTGTLSKVFGDHALPPKVPSSALADLNKKQALAGYRLTGGHAGPFYWFVDENGKEGERYHDWQATLIGRGPKTVEPYPISPEEAEFLSRSAD